MINNLYKISSRNNIIKRFFPKFPNFNEKQLEEHLTKLYDLKHVVKPLKKFDDKKYLNLVKENIKKRNFKASIRYLNVIIENFELDENLYKEDYIQLMELKEDLSYKNRDYLLAEEISLNLLEMQKQHSDSTELYLKTYLDYLMIKNISNSFQANELFRKLSIKKYSNELLYKYFWEYSVNELICGYQCININTEYINKKDKTISQYFKDSNILLNTCFDIPNWYLEYQLLNNKALINYYNKSCLKEDINIKINNEIKSLINDQNNFENIKDISADTFKNNDSILPLLFHCFKDMNYFNPLDIDNLGEFLNDNKAILEISQNENYIKILLNLAEILLQSNLKFIKKLGRDYLNIAFKSINLRNDNIFMLRSKFLYSVFLFDEGKIQSSEKLLLSIIHSNNHNFLEDYLIVLSLKMLEKIDTNNSSKIKYNDKIKYYLEEKSSKSYHILLLKLIY